MNETVQIPKGWELKKLSDVFTESTKKWLPNKNLQKENYIGLENIESHSGNLIAFTPTSSSEIKSSKTVFTKDSILYGKLRPYLNKVFLPNFNGICSTDILVLTPKSITTREFLVYFLRSPNVLSSINESVYGTKMPRTKVSFLKELPIFLPPLPIQKKIVQKLDEILGQLEEKKKQIIELKDKRRETISKLSQKTIGGMILNYMKIDNPPKNWQVKTIDECTDIQPGFAQGQKNILDGTIHLRMNNIGKNFQLNFDKVRTINATKEQLEKYRLEKGDVIFNNTNSPELVGKSFLFDDKQLCLYSNHLTRCRVKKELILPEWLLFYIRGKWLRRDFERMCNKWINQAAVGSDKLKKMQIPIPSLTEQTQILKILTNASKQFEQISDFEKTIKIRDIQNQTLLQNIQASILDAAFSGKLVQ